MRVGVVEIKGKMQKDGLKKWWRRQKRNKRKAGERKGEEETKENHRQTMSYFVQRTRKGMNDAEVKLKRS